MIRLLVALGLLLPALTGADAWAQDGETVDTVRYSYEKWSRGGQAQYVLEPMPISIKKGGLKDRANALFRVLSAAKSGSYGKAALAFRDDVDQTGIIWVHLDPEKARYNPIVMAETTYTFTENGATRVIFPKVFERGWTRDDVPFAAYTLTVPLWQTLPPAGIGGALARLPDGSYLGSDDAIARLQKGDAALIEAELRGPGPEGPGVNTVGLTLDEPAAPRFLWRTVSAATPTSDARSERASVRVARPIARAKPRVSACSESATTAARIGSRAPLR